MVWYHYEFQWTVLLPFICDAAMLWLVICDDAMLWLVICAALVVVAAACLWIC